MKTIIHILGAGASGKSTLSRAIGGADPEEITTDILTYHMRKEPRSPYYPKVVLFPNGVAIAGNYKHGSDSVAETAKLNTVIDYCLSQRDFVLVDPVRSSNKFVRWMEAHPERPAAVFVYLNISLEENIRRLKARRELKGKIGELPEKTYNNVLAFRERARGTWQFAVDNYKRIPVRFVTTNDSHTVLDIVKLVRTACREVHAEGTSDTNLHPQLP